MEKMRKIIKKRDFLNRGFVKYLYPVQYNVTKDIIDTMYQEIKKDFPDITEQHISIKIEENVLELNFFSFNLPQKGTGNFEEPMPKVFLCVTSPLSENAAKDTLNTSYAKVFLTVADYDFLYGISGNNQNFKIDLKNIKEVSDSKFDGFDGYAHFETQNADFLNDSNVHKCQHSKEILEELAQYQKIHFNKLFGSVQSD